MKQALLPDLKSCCVVDDGVTLELQVEQDNPCFLGHFDGFPLAPGVVQLGWVIYFASHQLGVGLPKPPQPVLKFQQPIFPGDNFFLHLTWLAGAQRLNYRLTSPAGEQHASGRLQY